MSLPTTLPDALSEIDRLRGQVCDLMRLLEQDPKTSNSNGDAACGLLAMPAAESLSNAVEARQTRNLPSEVSGELRQMMNTIPDVIFRLDIAANLVSWNKRLEEVTGFTAQELNNRPALSFVPEHEHANTAAAIRQAFEEGYAELIGHLLTKDQRTIPYHWTGASIRNDQGELIGITGVGRDITDEQRVEEALRQNEAYFRALIENSSDIITVLDFDGRVRFESPAFSRLLGYDQHEIDGQIAFDFIHPDDLPPVLEKFQLVIQRWGETQTVEFRFRHKDGSWRSLEAIGRAACDSKGIPCVIANSRDNTERKLAEQTIDRAEILYRTIFERAGAGVMQIDSTTGRFLKVNKRYCEIMNLTESELLATDFMSITHDDDLVGELVEMERLLKGELRSFTTEKRLVRKDGSVVWVSLIVAPMWQTGEDPSSHIAVVQDITARKQADEAMRLSEERYARATAIGKVGVWELDVGAGMYSSDVNLKKMLGYEADELSSDPFRWLNLVHPDDQATAIEHWHDIVGGAIHHYNLELRMVRKDGSVIWTDVRGHAVRNETGAVTRLIGATVDVSDRKNAEEALKKSHAFLRQVIDVDPNFIFAKDRHGRFILANKALADCYGSTVENLIGKSDGQFNANCEEVAFFQHHDFEVLNSLQERFIPEEKITDAAGRVRWLQTVKRPIRDEQGNFSMVLGASTDITARKHMEAKLRQRERDLQAALDERQRISEDLHDGILQSLYAVGLRLENSRSLIEGSAGQKSNHRVLKVSASLDQAIRELNNIMSEIRNFIAGLESQVLQGGDFATAMRAMVKSLVVASDLSCHVSIDQNAVLNLSTERALQLMNVVREAMSNCVRHSRAKWATVSLKLLTRSVRLAITDNGVGFNPATVRGVGNGLANMAARAKKIGGQLVVRSAPRHGTKLYIDFHTETYHAHP